MNAYHLKKVENQYELKIRGLDTEGTADELRRRLMQSVRVNAPVDDAIVAALVIEDELDECEQRLTDLQQLSAGYDGDFADTEAQRINARLWHNYLRVQRIPLDGDAPDDDENQRRETLLRGFRTLLDRFDNDKTKNQTEGENSASSGSTPAVTAPPATAQGASNRPPATVVVSSISATTHNTQPPPTPAPQATSASASGPLPSVSVEYQSRGRAVPVYKWGLQFDGKTQSVGAFLQRVEELRRARGMTPAELFDSAVDLFIGPALVWYRSTLGRIRNWDQLCQDLEVVFKPPDHDIRLQQEIFNRLQGEAESIDLYIAAMEGLYSRLAIAVPEEVRLKQIYHNLSPQLQDRLALFDVATIEQLRQLGRKAEAGRFRSGAVRSTHRGPEVMEPDLAYTPMLRRQGRDAPHGVAPERKVFQAASEPEVTCYKCHAKGHISRGCTSASPSPATEKVCWRCNKAGHIQRFCRARINSNGRRPAGNEAGSSGVAASGSRQ